MYLEKKEDGLAAYALSALNKHLARISRKKLMVIFALLGQGTV